MYVYIYILFVCFLKRNLFHRIKFKRDFRKHKVLGYGNLEK